MCPAIYFCVKENVILYIGQSQNLHYRWRHHHRYHQLVKEQNVVDHWVECVEDTKRMKIEQFFIKLYKPVQLHFQLFPSHLKILRIIII